MDQGELPSASGESAWLATRAAWPAHSLVAGSTGLHECPGTVLDEVSTVIWPRHLYSGSTVFHLFALLCDLRSGFCNASTLALLEIIRGVSLATLCFRHNLIAVVLSILFAGNHLL